MKEFSYKDYVEALKDAGPKLCENILERARNDGNIDPKQYEKLEDIAYKHK